MTPTRIAYLVHDYTDNSIVRRANMLAAGGAVVGIAGFKRSHGKPGVISSFPVVDLGDTADGRLTRRVASVGRAIWHLDQLEHVIRGSDAILARNLEMLLIAGRARQKFAPRARLIYECLDIHRLLLATNPAGMALRAIEGVAWRDVDLLLTSSPRFVSEYFQHRRFNRPVYLVENKIFLATGFPLDTPASARPIYGPPWKIGWFGMIRCRKSLEILKELVRMASGLLEVEIRGRPSPREFPDFDLLIAGDPRISFGGPYSPEELPAMYGRVHFSWAIDFFEEGQNSDWLLPNRIYESTYFGAVPIARCGTETARWVAEHGIETSFADPKDLAYFLSDLTREKYASLRGTLASIPPSSLADTPESCRRLVRAITDQDGTEAP